MDLVVCLMFTNVKIAMLAIFTEQMRHSTSLLNHLLRKIALFCHSDIITLHLIYGFFTPIGSHLLYLSKAGPNIGERFIGRRGNIG